MYVFLPLLLLQLCIVGSIVFFCLNCLVAAMKAARARRYDKVIAALSPVLLLTVFGAATFFWISN